MSQRELLFQSKGASSSIKGIKLATSQLLTAQLLAKSPRVELTLKLKTELMRPRSEALSLTV